MQNRTLYFGDNLEVLREKIPDESFDLIYLDPPFNSKRPYNILFKEGLDESPAQAHAFEDSWHWSRSTQQVFHRLVTETNENISNLMQGMGKMIGHNDVMAYLTMMTVRLVELRRVLKPAGSIYLHCDPTASHYLKIAMDTIFGKENFRNEVSWRRGHSFKHSGYQFPRVHDVILFYSKSDQMVFNKSFSEYEEGTLRNYTYDDSNGRGKYRLQALRTYGADTIKKLKDDNRIFVTSSGKQWLKQYLNEKEGRSVDDFWDDIRSLEVMREEQLHYPTQKPEALLERIIKASSNEGDWVLDPFCGCGTTIAVAEKLNRNWIGIDVSSLSIKVIKDRLSQEFESKALIQKIQVDGLPKDLSGAKLLFEKNPWDFQYWVLFLINGAVPPQGKSAENAKGADKGVDGIITFLKDTEKHEYGKIIIQIKGGHVQRNQIATLKGDIEREKAEGGLFVTLEPPTKPMIDEAIEAGSFSVNYALGKEFPRVQILTVAELLNGRQSDLPYGMVEEHFKKAQASESENNHRLF